MIWPMCDRIVIYFFRHRFYFPAQRLNSHEPLIHSPTVRTSRQAVAAGGFPCMSSSITNFALRQCIVSYMHVPFRLESNILKYRRRINRTAVVSSMNNIFTTHAVQHSHVPRYVYGMVKKQEIRHICTHTHMYKTLPGVGINKYGTRKQK